MRQPPHAKLSKTEVRSGQLVLREITFTAARIETAAYRSATSEMNNRKDPPNVTQASPLCKDEGRGRYGVWLPGRTYESQMLKQSLTM